MANFKVGDRVRVVRQDGFDPTITIGMIGTVMESDVTPYVAIDGLTSGHSGDGAWPGRSDIRAIHEWQLELVSDKPDTAERDQLARDILMTWANDLGSVSVDDFAKASARALIAAFDLADAFFAERAKRGGA